MKIAVIDDNNTVLKVNQIMLKKEGYLIENDFIKSYLSIEDFNQDNDKLDFDIIVCDYDLGKSSINGLDFFKQLRQKNFEGMYILLTGDDSIVLKAKISLSKDIHYIIKNTNKDNTSTVSQLGKLFNEKRIVC